MRDTPIDSCTQQDTQLYGLGGIPCDNAEILKATNAMNALEEDKYGNITRILNGLRDDINWSCAAQNITITREQAPDELPSHSEKIPEELSTQSKVCDETGEIIHLAQATVGLSDLAHSGAEQHIPESSSNQPVLNPTPWSPEMSQLEQSSMPLLKDFMKLWTEVDTQGFDQDARIAALKQTLQQAQRDGNTSQMVQASNAIKNTKVQIACEQRAFDQHVTTVSASVSAFASAATLLGNAKLAREIQIIGTSVVKIGSTIAGLSGYGAAAASITPVTALATLLGCAVNLMSLGRSRKDPNQALLHQLYGVITKLYREMHERFDAVMLAIDTLSQQQWHQFMSMTGQLALFEQRFALHASTIMRANQTIQASVDQVLERVESHRKDELARHKTDTLRALRSDINEAVSLAMEGSTQGGGHYDAARVRLLNYIRTQAYGASHEDIVGACIDPQDYPTLLRSLDVEPSFSLQTLLHIARHAYGSPSIARPSSAELVLKLRSLLTEISTIWVSQAVAAHQLICANPAGDLLKEPLLTHLLTADYPDSTKHVLVPMYLNARWHLLLLNRQDRTIDYMTWLNRGVLYDQVLLVLSGLGFQPDQIRSHVIAVDLEPYLSHAWLTTAFMHIESDSNMQAWVTAVCELSDSEINKAVNTDVIAAQISAIQNPYVVFLLANKLLGLTYAEHEQLGATPMAISNAEVMGFQDFIRATDEIYEARLQLNDQAIMKAVLQKFRESLARFSTALQRHLAEFDQQISQEFSLRVKELARTHYHKQDIIDKFCQQNISVSCNYGSWFASGASVDFYYKWDYIIRSSREVDHEGHINSRARNYVDSQVQSIRGFTHRYVTERQQQFSSFEARNEHRVFGPLTLAENFMPVVIIPVDVANPLLPFDQRLLNYCTGADIIKAVLARGLGTLCVTYTYAAPNALSISFALTLAEGPVVPVASLLIDLPLTCFNGAEKIWWSVVGGSYASSAANGAANNSSRQSHSMFRVGGSKYDCRIAHYYLPVIANHPALMEQIVNGTVACRDVISPDAMHTAVEQLDQQVTAFNLKLRQRYANELKTTLKHDTNELGARLAELSAHYKILKLLMQLNFEAQVFENSEYVFDCDSAYRHLNLHPELFLAEALIPQQYLEQLDTFFEHQQALLNTLGVMPTPIVEYLLTELLGCADFMAQDLTQRRTNAERVKFYEALDDMVNHVLANGVKQMETDPSYALKFAEICKQGLVAKAALKERFEQTSESIPALLSSGQQSLLTDGAASTLRQQTVFRQRGSVDGRTPLLESSPQH